MNEPSFRNSIAWKRAMELTACVYSLTRAFPAEERFGLTNQLRRASVSIASNIAEGKGRLTRGEFLQFLGIARGSALEVQCQLEIASMLRFGNAADIEEASNLSGEILRILNASIATTRERMQGKTVRSSTEGDVR